MVSVHAWNSSLGEGDDEEAVYEGDMGAILEREKSAAKSETVATKPRCRMDGQEPLQRLRKLLYEQRSRFRSTRLPSSSPWSRAAMFRFKLICSQTSSRSLRTPQALLDQSQFWSKM